ncbi:hypothetical protein D3C75_1079660 [compost metagenome]
MVHRNIIVGRGFRIHKVAAMSAMHMEVDKTRHHITAGGFNHSGRSGGKGTFGECLPGAGKFNSFA